MDKKAKLQSLQTLDEAHLREDVLVPLLGRLDYKAVHVYHGTREYGKDIVCFDFDKLGMRRFLAVVAKVENLTGSVSSESGLPVILNQVEQCFNEKYHDLFGMQSVTMDEVWVITTGRIKTGASDAIVGRLEKTNLSKLVRIIPGEELVDLIDRKFSSYWDAGKETLDYVRGQRDRLAQFLTGLLRHLGTDQTSCKEVTDQLLNSTSWEPKLFDLRGWAAHRLSAYSLIVDRGPASYVRGLVSGQCGDLIETFEKAREAVNRSIQSLEETVYDAQKVLEQPEPWDFVNSFEAKLRNSYPFDDRFGGARVVGMVQELGSSLDDIDDYLQRLKDAGLLDKVLQLVASLNELEQQTADYLVQLDLEEFSLSWVIVSDSQRSHIELHYDTPPDGKLISFRTTHRKQVPTYSRSAPETRMVTSRDVIESAQFALRGYFEEVLGCKWEYRTW